MPKARMAALVSIPANNAGASGAKSRPTQRIRIIKVIITNALEEASSSQASCQAKWATSVPGLLNCYLAEDTPDS
jgi:hypothetical protein